VPTDAPYNPREDPILREFLARVREAVGREPVETILFGSRARGDHDPMSDYDLIMVYDEVTPEMREAIRRTQSDVGFERDALISAFVYAEPDLARACYEPFMMNAAREGVAL